MLKNDLKTITPEDLIRQESKLKESLLKVFSFTAGSIYFPRQAPRSLRKSQGCYQPLYLQAEKKLLLPLAVQDRLLGIFMAQNVQLQEPKTVCRLLKQYIEIFLENLYLQKLQETDPESGALHRQSLLRHLVQEIELIRHSNQPQDPAAADSSFRPYRSSFGLVLFYVHNLRHLSLNYGYAFTEQVLNAIAAKIMAFITGNQILGRAGEASFGLLLPQAGPARCQDTARSILDSLHALQLEYKVTEEKVNPGISCGFSNYPQDLTGPCLQQPLPEQASLLLGNCSLAAQTAHNLGNIPEVLAFSEIINQGGRIIKNLAFNRILISLGKLSQAREGQRFLVTDLEPGPDQGPYLENARAKAEIILTRVDMEQSEGEILHLIDPSIYPEPGDRLLHQPAKQDYVEPELGLEQQDTALQPSLELMPLRKFLISWQKARTRASRFCLSLCRSPALTKDNFQKIFFDSEQDPACSPLSQELIHAGALLGEYSSNCWALYLPDQEKQTSMALLENLNNTLKELGCDNPSIGVAFYPCLNMHKAGILANARKALEHALLLAQPELVCFNSTSLTISADRLFNQNNLSTALEEYKLALLLDAENTLARNSLGICYARLGYTELAGQEFEKVLQQEPDNHRALYNLGSISWQLGDIDLAQTCFESCLEKTLEPSFCLLRLGQIAEQKRQISRARELYTRAGQSSPGRRFAFRFLGRLAFEQGQSAEAREHLHLALSNNPEDCEAMFLLARLYLQQDEDPEIAELLLSKSVALRPDQSEYVELLTQVLGSQGKNAQLQQLRTRTSFLPHIHT